MNTSFHTLKVGWTRCYLLKASEGYLLIDTGFPECYPVFLKKLNQIGIDLPQIKWLFLTHHHDDHAGFAAKLIEETKARVIGASKDHFIPAEFCKNEIDSLTNVRSMTYRLFTEKEKAENHCNLGNIKLVLDTIIEWIELMTSDSRQREI